MAFSQIADVAPNYRDYGGWWLKAYTPGTTTPKVMSDNSTGSPQAAKYEINVDGFIVSSGSAFIIPFIDGDYDLYLFPTAAEADANDTSNALRLADDIAAAQSIDNKISYSFSSVSNLKAGTTGGEDITDELKELIGSGDVAASTLGYYGTYSDSESPSGGANYILTTLARAKAEKDSLWAPDTYGDHYLFGGTDYVATLNESEANIDYFGAIGDYDGSTGTDNQSNLSAALQSGLKVTATRDKRYLFNSLPVSVSNIPIEADMNGAEFIQKGDFALIEIIQDFTDLISVTSITIESIDLTDGEGGSLTPVAVLNVANSSAYNIGDTVKVFSDDLIAAVDPADTERLGEFARVSYIDTGKIYLYSPLRETYSTAIRVAKMNTDNSVSIKNMIVTSDSSVNASWNQPLVVVSGAYEPRLENIRSKQSRGDVVRLISCFGASSDSITAKDLTTNVTNLAFGYVLIEYSCEGGTHTNIKGYNARHVYTTGCLATTAGEASPEKYGSTRDFVVSDSYGFGCQNAAFDTHPDARNGMFSNCIGVSPYNGPAGTQVNYQLRGVGTEVSNCQSVGGRGYRIQADYDALGAARDNKILNSRHRYIKTYNQSREAVEINGASTTNTISGAVIDRLSCDKLSGSGIQYKISNADVEVINPQLRDVSTGSGLGTFIEASGVSNVRVSGGTLDYTSSTDPFIRMVELQDSTSKVYIDGLNIKGSVFWLADFNSTDATFIAKNLNLSVNALGTEAGLTNIGASSFGMVQYVVDDGFQGSNQFKTTTFAAGGAKTLELDYCGASNVYFKVSADALSTKINNLDDGLFYGQKATIQCGLTSANGFDVETSTGNIEIGSDVTLSQGESIVLIYDGTDWLLS